MGYAELAALILQVGLPLALRLAENYHKKGAIPPEELAELKEMGARTVQSQVQLAILRAGLSVDDPRAKELIALTTPK